MTPPRRCSRCGLLKAAYMFWCNGQGKPETICKTCHPIVRRERMTPERRARELAKQRERYRTDAAFRRRKIAYATARNRRVRAAEREEAA